MEVLLASSTLASVVVTTSLATSVALALVLWGFAKFGWQGILGDGCTQEVLYLAEEGLVFL